MTTHTVHGTTSTGGNRVFIVPGAQGVGDVEVGDDASIRFDNLGKQRDREGGT